MPSKPSYANYEAARYTHVFLCPMGTCEECDRHRRVEQELQCPLRGGYTAGLWRRFWHWINCGGGWSTYQPETGQSRCGFCGFLYEVYPHAE